MTTRDSMTTVGTIATVPAATYAMLQRDPHEIVSILQENMGPLGVGMLDLDQIKVPAGGGLAFTIPGPDGEETVKSYEMLVLQLLSASAAVRMETHPNMRVRDMRNLGEDMVSSRRVTPVRHSAARAA